MCLVVTRMPGRRLRTLLLLLCPSDVNSFLFVQSRNVISREGRQRFSSDTQTLVDSSRPS